jgi:hypothetical protein
VHGVHDAGEMPLELGEKALDISAFWHKDLKQY